MTILFNVLTIISFISATVGYIYLWIGILGAAVGMDYKNQETIDECKKDVRKGIIISVLAWTALFLLTKYTT